MVDGWPMLPGETPAEYKRRTDALLAVDFTNDTQIDGDPERSNRATKAREARKQERADAKQRKSERPKAAHQAKKNRK